MTLRACISATTLIASLCPPPGTWWDCSVLAPKRVCVVANGSTMSHDCTSHTLTLVDTIAGELVTLDDQTQHQCVAFMQPKPKISRTCDPNRDGKVSVGEVIQSVNGFLGKCAR